MGVMFLILRKPYGRAAVMRRNMRCVYIGSQIYKWHKVAVTVLSAIGKWQKLNFTRLPN